MIVSILLIAIVSLGGIALTYYLDVDEPMLWRASAGMVIGQAVFGTALFLLSFALGLTYLSVIAAAAIAVTPALFLRRNGRRKVFEHDWARAKGKLQSASYGKLVPFLYYF